MTIIQDAVFLCRNDTFQRWIERLYAWGEVDEQAARNFVCSHCRIKSRAELATNIEAATRFRKLEHDFRRSTSRADAA